MKDYQKRARELKAKAVLVGVSQRDIAKELNVNHVTVCNVLNANATSNPLLDKIEQVLDQQEKAAA